MMSKQMLVERVQRLRTHTVLHLVAILLFVGNLLLVPMPWRDVGFVIAGLLGIGAGLIQSFWEYRHDALTPVGRAIEWIVFGYLALAGWGMAELYIAWARAYYGLS